MTPIADVFMLSIDSKLDYNLLKKIVQTGHSRVPVYEEVDVPMTAISSDGTILPSKGQPRTQRVKKIMGILLVKQCVLLDPNGKFILSFFPTKLIGSCQTQPLCARYLSTKYHLCRTMSHF